MLQRTHIGMGSGNFSDGRSVRGLMAQADEANDLGRIVYSASDHGDGNNNSNHDNIDSTTPSHRDQFEAPTTYAVLNSPTARPTPAPSITSLRTPSNLYLSTPAFLGKPTLYPQLNPTPNPNPISTPRAAARESQVNGINE